MERISDTKIRKAINDAVESTAPITPPRAIAQAQLEADQKEAQELAEISFKAGIREVVEWILEHRLTYTRYSNAQNPLQIGTVVITPSELKAKLKEWEVERWRKS